MKIGFIGLGRMGMGIAGNLMAAGHDVTVWNRSPEPVAALAEKGAHAAKSVEETLQGELVFSMLANDAALHELGLDGAALKKAAKGLIHINMATISMALARELAKSHAAHGLGYISAPVFGRPDAAASGELLIVASGDATLLAKVEPLLAKLGRRVVIAGDRPEEASLFKIAGNFLIGAALESMSEAFALLARGGVDPAQFQEVMTSTLFAAPIYRNYGNLVVQKKFEPAGFALKLGFKDMKLAEDAARELKVKLALSEILHAHLDEAIQAGLGDKDWTAVSQIVKKRAWEH
jgi:3-hydroxyisobutyrate dehydrogenase-like beta-hydroxyacid dehydrogenase